MMIENQFGKGGTIMETPETLNWLATVTGTVVAFLAGWAWYSHKLFGKAWAAGSGIDPDKAGKMPVFALLTQVAALFVLALVVGITATTGALVTAVLAILAAALFVVSGGAFVKKTGTALAVDFGYILIAGGVMIAAQGIF
jgi:Protein of unknown function (DUF1761)